MSKRESCSATRLRRFAVFGLVLLSVTHGHLIATAEEGASPDLQRVEDLARIAKIDVQFIEQVSGRQYEQAVSTAEQLVALNERVFGQRSVNVGAALFDLGSAQRDYGQIQLAEASFKRAEPLITGSVRLSLFVNMASVQLRRYDADRAYEYARAAYKATGESTDTRSKGLILRLLALVQALRGNHRAAMAAEREAVSLARQTPGEHHSDLISSLAQLAKTEATVGMMEDSRALLQEALRVSQRKAAPSLLVQSAELWAEQGDYVQANAEYDQAITQLTDSYGASVPDLAEPLLGMAFVAESRIQFNEATALTQRAQLLAEEGLAEQHALRSKTLVVSGRLRTRAGYYDQGFRTLDAAWKSVDWLPKNAAPRFEIRLEQARNLAAQSEPKAAFALLKDTLKLPWLGVQPGLQFRALLIAADCLRQTGDHSLAVDLLREVATIQSPYLSYERVLAEISLARTNSDIEALMALGQREFSHLSPLQRLDIELAMRTGLGDLSSDDLLPQAIEQYRAASDLAASKLGDLHPEVGRLQLRLGSVLARDENPAFAEGPLKEAIRILGAADVSRPLPEFITAVTALADLYERLGSRSQQEIESLRELAKRLSAQREQSPPSPVGQGPTGIRGNAGACSACGVAASNPGSWYHLLFTIACFGAWCARRGIRRTTS